jgi:adenine-specific DNA-methyltransferase
MTRKKSASTNTGKSIEALTHKHDKRKNIPTAEYQAVMKPEEQAPRLLRYPRNTDLDPQLVWRGKDYQDWSDLVVPAPPLYIQEKIHPKALIDDLLRHTHENATERSSSTSSPTSTASPKVPTAPSSTATTPTGRTA